MISIPNLLSLLRILLVPMFAVIYLSMPEHGALAAAILVLSGLTDFLDGLIARKWNMVTDVGKVLDPLADKLTQLTICACLAIRHKEFILIGCLILVKELIMIGASVWLLRDGYQPPSSQWFGKIATAVFYVIAVYVVYQSAIKPEHLTLLAGIMALFAVVAFVLYIPGFYGFIRTKSRKNFR